MRTFLISSAIAVLLAAGASAGVPEGKAAYEHSCKACHGADGAGNPAIVKMMKVEIHPLSSAEVQSKSDSELKNIITRGTGKMKPPTSVTAAQVPDLVSYIRSLKK